MRAECGKLRSKLAKAAAAAKADREAHVAQLAELQSQSRRKESALAANTLRLTKTEKLHAKAGRECERLRVQLASHSVPPPIHFRVALSVARLEFTNHGFRRSTKPKTCSSKNSSWS